MRLGLCLRACRGPAGWSRSRRLFGYIHQAVIFFFFLPGKELAYKGLLSGFRSGLFLPVKDLALVAGSDRLPGSRLFLPGADAVVILRRPRTRGLLRRIRRLLAGIGFFLRRILRRVLRRISLLLLQDLLLFLGPERLLPLPCKLLLFHTLPLCPFLFLPGTRPAGKDVTQS